MQEGLELLDSLEFIDWIDWLGLSGSVDGEGWGGSVKIVLTELGELLFVRV